MSTFSYKHVAIDIRLAVAVSVLAIVIYVVKPWFISSERIQDDVLKLMPIGTSLEEVSDVISAKKRWYVFTAKGFVPWSSVSDEFLEDTINRKRISLSLRDYGNPLYYVFFSTSVLLTFDDDLRLIDVEASNQLTP